MSSKPQSPSFSTGLNVSLTGWNTAGSFFLLFTLVFAILGSSLLSPGIRAYTIAPARTIIVMTIYTIFEILLSSFSSSSGIMFAVLSILSAGFSMFGSVSATGTGGHTGIGSMTSVMCTRIAVWLSWFCAVTSIIIFTLSSGLFTLGEKMYLIFSSSICSRMPSEHSMK